MKKLTQLLNVYDLKVWIKQQHLISFINSQDNNLMICFILCRPLNVRFFQEEAVKKIVMKSRKYLLPSVMYVR